MTFIACALGCGSACAGQAEAKWIELLTEGYVCVMPAEYELPNTQSGMRARIAAGRYLYRNNSERGVYLRGDQVIGLSCVKSGELEFLQELQGHQLRALTLLAPWVTENGIKELKRCDGLHQLSLMLDRADNLKDVLVATPNLKYFAFSSPLNLNPATAPDKHFFDNEQFKLLGDLRDLRSIHIHSRLISDKGIRLVVKLRKLEVLGIRGTRLISNDGFMALSEAKQLKEVVLEAGPRCTDEGVKQLLKLQNLEWIEIYGMAKIEDLTIRELKTRFPNAEIQFKPLVGP